ncbi:Hypothetical protein T15F17.c [Arabidopsis thaliana]|uniref:Uncharacterized protein T15F17.c n=1 Tax=Arabidopsis thaliana TaxID=3702 RepID=Q9LKS2_ARATH|nr:Hypothetical protein T15F17.c [Arabidopsis thaliana]
MEMIDSALKGILRRTKGKKVPKGDLNDTPPVMLLLIHLCGYRKWAHTNGRKKVRGALSVGGVVTLILIACGVPLTSLGFDPRMMDLDHLRRCEFLEYDMGENNDFRPARDYLYFESATPTDDNVLTTEATEDDIAETDEDRKEEYDTSMYHFSEHVPPAPESKSLSEAHRNNSKLQRWCKKQDRLLIKCFKAITFLTDKISCLSSTIAIPQGERPQDMPSRRYDAPGPSHHRPEPSHHRPEPSDRVVPPVPARHSSFEPRELGRKKKAALARSGSRSTRLLQSRSLCDRGAGRSRRREVEYHQSGAGCDEGAEVEYPQGEAETQQGDSSMAWEQSQAAIDDQLRSFFH